VGCSDAPGEQLGVQCLAHGHYDLQLMGRAGIEPTTLGLQDDPLTPLSYSRQPAGALRLFQSPKNNVVVGFLNIFFNELFN